MRGKATCHKTYTFRAQDVYVSHSKRIRFRCKTYTFYSRYVYVSLGKGIRLALSPSKLPFSTKRCTSPQEVTFIPAHRTSRAHTRTHLAPTKSHSRSDVVASAMAWTCVMGYGSLSRAVGGEGEPDIGGSNTAEEMM